MPGGHIGMHRTVNEDDTFRKLRQIPFQEMTRLFAESRMTLTTPGFEKLFTDNDWTSEEYLKTYYNTFMNE